MLARFLVPARSVSSSLVVYCVHSLPRTGDRRSKNVLDRPRGVQENYAPTSQSATHINTTCAPSVVSECHICRQPHSEDSDAVLGRLRKYKISHRPFGSDNPEQVILLCWGCALCLSLAHHLYVSMYYDDDHSMAYDNIAKEHSNPGSLA